MSATDAAPARTVKDLLKDVNGFCKRVNMHEARINELCGVKPKKTRNISHKPVSPVHK